MGSRNYDNFDLLIESVDPRTFRVRVTQCAVGETPAALCALPFSEVELENVLLKLDPGRAGTRRILDPYSKASVDLGTGLFDSVFRDDVLVAWSRSVDVARERQRGLRLRLRLVDAPALAGLPWEFLYDRRGKRFFAQSDRTPIVRYLDVANPPRPLVVGGPLRVLVVISSPHDLAPLQVEQEWAGIRDALADKVTAGLVVVDRLPHASLGELQKWLRHHDVHVLHFVGHGDFDQRTGDGVLAFCDLTGRAIPVSSAQLGAHVRDHDPLRLVVLNACQTATTDNIDVYSGMAQGLIQQEAAAVVAMQFPITDGAAIVFTTEFYGALADGEPVDQAVTSARKAMLTDFGREWATPVLFLRSADGQIFDRIENSTPSPTPVMSNPVPPKIQAARRAAADPEQAPADIAPAPHHGDAPNRRKRVALAVAALLVVSGALVAAVVSRSGENQPTVAQVTTGPPRSLARTSRLPVPTIGKPPPLPRFALTGSSPVSAFSGPSSHAYQPATQLPVGTTVGLVCSLYGEIVSLPGVQEGLWYWTDHNWINDISIETGRNTPVVNACSGTVNSPSVGSQPPSATLGPFGLIGRADILIRHSPRASADQVGVLKPDALVVLRCHVSSDNVEAPPGGTTGADWDLIGADAWIPDAYLLTGRPGSPAPACGPAPEPAPSGSPQPTTTSGTTTSAPGLGATTSPSPASRSTR